MAKRRKKKAAAGERCRFGRSTRGPTKGRCRKSAPKKTAGKKAPAKSRRAGKKIRIARRSAVRTRDMRAGTATKAPSAAKYGKVALPYHPAALNHDWNG